MILSCHPSNFVFQHWREHMSHQESPDYAVVRALTNHVGSWDSGSGFASA